MPKNSQLETYPQLWAVRRDWDNTNRDIRSSQVSNTQLLRTPQVGEELWIHMASHHDNDGVMKQVPWEKGDTMAAALVRVMAPGFRARWIATVSGGGNTVSVFYEGENVAVSIQEMILVCAYQVPLFPDPEIVVGKIVGAT